MGRQKGCKSNFVDENGNWRGNRNGRPLKPEVAEFRAALDEAKKKHNIGLIAHAVEKAYTDNDILREILKKILPDKLETANNADEIDAILDKIQELLSGDKDDKEHK